MIERMERADARAEAERSEQREANRQFMQMMMIQWSGQTGTRGREDSQTTREAATEETTAGT
jgi:hypothetical protein